MTKWIVRPNHTPLHPLPSPVFSPSSFAIFQHCAWRSRAQARHVRRCLPVPAHDHQTASACFLPLQCHLSSPRPATRQPSSLTRHALMSVQDACTSPKFSFKCKGRVIETSGCGSAALRAPRLLYPSPPRSCRLFISLWPILHAIIRKLSACYVTYRDSDVSRRRIAFLKSLPPSAGYWLVFSSLLQHRWLTHATTTLFPCVNNPLRAQRSPHSTW